MRPGDLRHLLTAADAASPPPPAAPFAPERLARRLRQRRLRAAMLATAAVAAGAVAALLLRAPPVAAAPASAATLAAFRDEVRAGMALLEQRLATIDGDRAAIDDQLRRSRLACDRAITAGQQFTVAYASFDPAAAARQRAAFAALHAGRPGAEEPR